MVPLQCWNSLDKISKLKFCRELDKLVGADCQRSGSSSPQIPHPLRFLCLVLLLVNPVPKVFTPVWRAEHIEMSLALGRNGWESCSSPAVTFSLKLYILTKHNERKQNVTTLKQKQQCLTAHSKPSQAPQRPPLPSVMNIHEEACLVSNGDSKHRGKAQLSGCFVSAAQAKQKVP